LEVCCATSGGQSTLAECPAWDVQRRGLTNVMGDDLSLPVMIGSEEAWSAVVSYCESFMTQKEAAERERRQEAALC